MAYYYTLDSDNYFTRWSVGAAFHGCSTLPAAVAVPEPLQHCACNVQAYKYENGVITYDPDRESVGDLYSPVSEGRDGKDGISCTHEWKGTMLYVTSASGTSSADLKGEKGDNYKIGTGLKVTGDDNDTLEVDSADDFGGDNSRPASASLLETTVGNIEVLLGTI